jgi:hypothetical protein
MSDRRFDVRFTVQDSINLSWRDQTGQEQQVPADLADISRSGASARVQHPVKVGTTLALDYQNQQLVGKVRHCKTGASGFVLGIEFEDGYRWSPRP